MRGHDFEPYDLRTPAEKARYTLLEYLSALVQYVANDPQPSVYDRFQMLRELTDPDNWRRPRVAAERMQSVLSERRGHTSFVAYLGQALAAIEKYASVSGVSEGSAPAVVDQRAEHIGSDAHHPAAAAGVRV